MLHGFFSWTGYSPVDGYTIIILITFFGFLALAAILLVPVYRFLRREERSSRKWTTHEMGPAPSGTDDSDTKKSVQDEEKSAPDTESSAPDTEKSAPDTERSAPDEETLAPDAETAAPERESAGSLRGA